jgi:hypothetical protein
MFARRELDEVFFAPPRCDVRYAAEQQDNGTACGVRIKLWNAGPATPVTVVPVVVVAA